MKQKILIVDDDLLISELLKFMLERAGYDVHCCVETPNALSELKKQSFDLVILDVSMQRFNGLHFIEDVKKEQTIKSIPILVLASSFDKSTVLKAKQLGAQYYVIKPPAREDLLSLVSQILGLAQNRNAG